YLPEAGGDLVTVIGGRDNPSLVHSYLDLAPTATDIPVITPPVLFFDVSDTLMAFLGPSGQPGGFTLYAGGPSQWVPLAAPVQSHVWHATEPGRLGWVETGRGLCVANLDRDGSIVEGPTCLDGITGRLVGFDDHGVLMVEEEVVSRITLTGEQINQVRGSDARIAPDGRVLVATHHAQGPIVSLSVGSPDLESMEELHIEILDWEPGDTDGVALFVALSPRSTEPELALLVAQEGEFQIQVWDLDGNLVETRNIEGRPWGIEWDRSGRFLLAPGIFNEQESRVYVYDLFREILTFVPFETWVQDTQLVIPAQCENASRFEQDWTLGEGVGIENLQMVLSRDAGLESWRFLSGRIAEGPNVAELATWALPAYTGEHSPQQSIPANQPASDVPAVQTNMNPNDSGVSDWMDIDGARISQWCVTQTAN
ncbi:MAG TPA: hypothetical protein VE569_10185, partial [Acidimicrobiia bacterium]|nr:hypothetical protein [Acidimicrobiia bacterium]